MTICSRQEYLHFYRWRKKFRDWDWVRPQILKPMNVLLITPQLLCDLKAIRTELLKEDWDMEKLCDYQI